MYERRGLFYLFVTQMIYFLMLLYKMCIENVYIQQKTGRKSNNNNFLTYSMRTNTYVLQNINQKVKTFVDFNIIKFVVHVVWI